MVNSRAGSSRWSARKLFADKDAVFIHCPGIMCMAGEGSEEGHRKRWPSSLPGRSLGIR